MHSYDHTFIPIRCFSTSFLLDHMNPLISFLVAPATKLFKLLVEVKFINIRGKTRLSKDDT